MRFASVDQDHPQAPCCRCGVGHRPWDQVADQAYCPHCLEALIVGEGEPLVIRSESRHCAVCHQLGTVRYLTFPLNSAKAVEIDLCGEHLRALLGRRLGPHAFAQLRRQLYALGLEVARVFLLHDAFYDRHGRALQPAIDLDYPT